MARFGALNNVLFRAGETESPGVPIPSGAVSCSVEVERNNWPDGGCLLELLFSYDGQNYVVGISQQIAPFVATPKQQEVTPAVIGYGWSSPQPTHIKGRLTAPAQFRAGIVYETV